MNLKATAFDSPQGQCIHQIFEAQVERTPDAPAVSYKDQRLTYRQLNDRANLLARDLRGGGVGPEVLVGVCLARSVEMVVATLGILKAGGAYLPLDPLYPRERLSFLLEDSDVSLLVTQKHRAANLPHYKREVVYLDSLGPIAERSDENLEDAASLENLAYVIYTSGSTGTPKGVEITHANLLNLVLWHQTAFQVTLDDRASVLASVGFDCTHGMRLANRTPSGRGSPVARSTGMRET